LANLEQWLNSVRAFSITHFFCVPTAYALIDRLALHDDYFEAPELACLISTSAKLDEGLWLRLAARFKKPLFNQYGLTETVTAGIYAGPHPEMGPIGTIGKPVDIKVRLVGVDGADVVDGDIGELWIAGEIVFAGYWQASRLTAEALTEDGWLRTGDLAKKRADGSYEILGRLKTVILCGGLLIRPEEIDEALLSHPGVIEAATIGIPDSDFGEIPVSVVVLGDNVDEVQLTKHCRLMLEPIKMPRRIKLVEKIERGDAGKPNLGELRKHFEQGDVDRGSTTELVQTILEIASLTFRIAISDISLQSSPTSISGWDSFAHINLVLNAERRFGVRIPTAYVATIKTLADLKNAIERVQ
jgi:long-chain acyl-CoA synthetase